MATNYRILEDQIMRLYSRGIDREDVSPRLDRREIRPLIVQSINALIKPEVLSRGEVVGSVIATYTLPVEGDKYKFSTLTVTPISLPKEQGIHRVHEEGCPWAPYVPIRSGDFDIVQGTPTEYIEGQKGYYQEGKKIMYTKDPGVEDMVVKLIVHDPEQINDTDVLPIPPEMEPQVIETVLSALGLSQIGQTGMAAKNEQTITNPRQNDSI